VGLKITRRSFMKKAAATTTSLGLGSKFLGKKAFGFFGKANAKVKPEEEKRLCICEMCDTLCTMTVHVEDEKCIKVSEGPPDTHNRGHLCSKGLSAMQNLYLPDRIKTPLKRTGERGGGKWKKITWDEALGEIADNLNRIREKHGPQAIACYSGASFGHWNLNSRFLQRFMNVMGSPNYGASGSLCFNNKVVGYVGTCGTFPWPDYKHARCIINWGANDAYSGAPASYDLLEAIGRGVKFITIDPRFTVMASKSDLYLPIRPGTDGALANAMMHVVIKEGLYDSDFISNWTYGFDKLAALMQEYPPERVEKITGVPASKIREVALAFAKTKPACIWAGNGVDHHTGGCQAVRSISCLVAITGNYGVKGGMVEFPIEVPTANISLCEKIPEEYKPLGQDRFPLINILGRVDSSFGTAQTQVFHEAVLNGLPYPIKAIFTMGGNMTSQFPNTNLWIKTVKKLDFFFVVDPLMNPDAQFADIVLPPAIYLERNDLHTTFYRYPGQLFAIFKDKGVQPMWETYSDWEIIMKLARRMGLGEYFAWKSHKELVDEMLKPADLTYEKVKGKGFHYPCETPYKSYREKGFNTPTKKLELYSKLYEQLGHPPLPHYVEPAESPVSTPKLAEDYPLVLNTGGRIAQTVHNQFYNLPWLHQIVPEPGVEIHPNDAFKYGGIKDGEMVIVESPRGSIKIRAKVTMGIIEGTVYLPDGWKQANVNLLTNSNLDIISGFPSFKSQLCRVRKV